MGFSIEAGVSVLTVFRRGCSVFSPCVLPSGAPVSGVSLGRD